MIQVILWVTALAQFVIAILSFINGGLVRKTVIGAIVMICGTAWTAVLLFASYLVTKDNIVLLNQLIMIVGVILFYFVCLLGLSFIEIKAKVFYLIAFLMAIPATVLSLSPILAFQLYFVDLRVLDDGEVILKTNPVGFIIIVLVLLIYVGVALASLVLARKRAETKLGKKLVLFVIIGVVLGFLSPLIFNVANAEVHELHPLGPFGLLAMAFLTYSALVKHGDDRL